MARQFFGTPEGKEKLWLFAGAVARKQICSCPRLRFCNDCTAAIDHRGFIKVDEVDGRSPVERAAATSCTRPP